MSTSNGRAGRPTVGPPAPAHPGAGARVRVTPPMAVQRSASAGGENWKLTVGRYRHEGPRAAGLHPDVASHSFVALEGPGGRREAWGFVPARHHDPRREVQALRAGVTGSVQPEQVGRARHGAATQELALTPQQARAARAEIERYARGQHRFRLGTDDCHGFADAVRKAAQRGR